MSTIEETKADEARAAAQLAMEIAWCVDMLEKQLEGGKLGEKKAKDFRKAKKLLKNKDTPLIQQRQLMRTHCGDYRAKMKAEEESVRLDSSKVKFNEVQIKTTKNNFIKKAVSSKKKCDNEDKTEFKFNFKDPSNS